MEKNSYINYMGRTWNCKGKQQIAKLGGEFFFKACVTMGDGKAKEEGSLILELSCMVNNFFLVRFLFH